MENTQFDVDQPIGTRIETPETQTELIQSIPNVNNIAELTNNKIYTK